LIVIISCRSRELNGHGDLLIKASAPPLNNTHTHLLERADELIVMFVVPIVGDDLLDFMLGEIATALAEVERLSDAISFLLFLRSVHLQRSPCVLHIAGLMRWWGEEVSELYHERQGS
jgi:hypothetical protein